MTLHFYFLMMETIDLRMFMETIIIKTMIPIVSEELLWNK